MKIVYDEQYGELSYMQRAAYRKHNVSPSDHIALVNVWGERNFSRIEKDVRNPKFHGPGNMFSLFLWIRWYRHAPRSQGG